MLVASALTLTFMGSRQPASAQKSPAFGAKFKIAEGADLRILDDNIWDYSQDTIPPRWKEIGEDPRDFKRAPQFARLVKDYMPTFSLSRSILSICTMSFTRWWRRRVM